jgi:hypothetical protein
MDGGHDEHEEEGQTKTRQQQLPQPRTTDCPPRMLPLRQTP